MFRNFRKEVRVSQSGTISIPLIPVRLRVAGLSETQAEEKIAELLEANGLVSHPEVGVAVKEHRSQPITVVGAIQHPWFIKPTAMLPYWRFLPKRVASPTMPGTPSS